jgi:hypothetical protein
LVLVTKEASLFSLFLVLIPCQCIFFYLAVSVLFTILTHGKKFQGAVKELRILVLESVTQKLSTILAVRKQKN